MIALAHLLFLIGSLAAPSFAAQEDEAELKKDLTAVIALHGLPCGEVVAVTVQAQRDYLASCKDGNKYRVYENDKGRVVVEKRE
jgi:hypothetical protein